MKDCIFCKIANGEKPCFEIYEDDLVKVFLDIKPASDGHLLVVTRKHYENIFDVPEELLEKVVRVCKKMALLCKNKLGATGVNILNASGKDAQQSVFHLHFHIVPRNKRDGLGLWLRGNKKKFSEPRDIQKKLLS